MENSTLDELARLTFLVPFTSPLHVIPNADGWVASGLQEIFYGCFRQHRTYTRLTRFYSLKGNIKRGDHRDPLSRCISANMRKMYIKRVMDPNDYFRGFV